MHHADMAIQTSLLPLPPDLVHRDRIRRQALRVATVHHEGLALLHDVAFVSEGLALTWDVPDGVVDATPMDAASALRLMAPIAAGLALLHDAGLAHGGVCAANILDVEGSGLLMGWRPGGTSEDDVRDIATVLDEWLPSASIGADVAHMLIVGADPDPLVRPTMARMAAVLERECRHALPLTSPPAHRRARVIESEAPPPRLHSPVEVASPRATRGRHAASRASAGRPLLPITGISWRWAIAGAGALAAAFLGFTAVNSAVASDVGPSDVCPASAVSEERAIGQ
jgi:hypothetical protein